MSSVRAASGYRAFYERTTPGGAARHDAGAGAAPSFTLNALNGGATKLAEQLASPGVVLAALLAISGAPSSFVGALEPVRRGFATLPQLLFTPVVDRQPVKSRVWSRAAYLQALTLLAVAALSLVVDGWLLGLVVIAGLVVFSTASGVASSAFSDVVAKTVPKPARNRLLAVRSGLGGVATLLAGLLLLAGVQDIGSRTLYAVLIAVAAGLWAVGAYLFQRIAEEPGDVTITSRTPVAAVLAGLALMRTQAWFRRFTISRAFLVAVEIVIPYVTLLAVSVLPSIEIGLLVLAIGAAQLLGSPFWGRLTDVAAGRVALVVAGALGLVTIALSLLFLYAELTNALLLALVLFVAAMASEGVRTARKAFLINRAPKDEKFLYTASSNAVTGVVLLLSALLGLLIPVLGLAGVFWVLAAATTVGTALVITYPEQA